MSTFSSVNLLPLTQKYVFGVRAKIDTWYSVLYALVKPNRLKTCLRQGASSGALRGCLRQGPLASREGGRWSRRSLRRDQDPGRIQLLVLAGATSTPPHHPGFEINETFLSLRAVQVSNTSFRNIVRKSTGIPVRTAVWAHKQEAGPVRTNSRVAFFGTTGGSLGERTMLIRRALLCAK